MSLRGQVDGFWKDLMRKAHAQPNALESCIAPKLLSNLKRSNPEPSL